MKVITWFGVLAAALAAVATAGNSSGAATTPAPAGARQTEPPSASAPAALLARPHFEMPPADPETDIQSCAVCRLAAATTGRIPADAFRIESEMIERGATLRLVASDPSVRDVLWNATLARGQVLAALRSDSGVHLCSWCRERRQMLADLEIAARRIPEGVLLTYTSASPALVRRIQTAVRAGSEVPL